MESATRGAYARRGNIKVDTTDETHRLSALLEAAIDAWNADTRTARAKRPEPRHWHKQHQAPVRKSLAELISWTDYASEGVKYYSGTGTYIKTIKVSADWLGQGHFIDLDLGDVRELAEVFVNGQSAGVLWKPPFRTDITTLLKPGNNELKIEVMNLWINRLSGDMNLPDDQKFTRTNIHSDGATPKVKAEPWHIETSGLLGPVRLIPSLLVPVGNSRMNGSREVNQTVY